MNKIVKRMRNKDIFAAWGRWRDYLSRLEMVRAKERRVQLVMKNILLRMAKKLLVLGHESWRNWMVGQKRLRQIGELDVIVIPLSLSTSSRSSIPTVRILPHRQIFLATAAKPEVQVSNATTAAGA